MVVWVVSWVLYSSLVGWLASGLTGVEGPARFVWPARATVGQVIKMVAAHEGEPFVVLPSARGSLDACAPQVVPSEMSVGGASDILREWLGLAAWRFEGVWVWFAEPAMPSLFRVSAWGEVVSPVLQSAVETRLADLDLEDAGLPEVVAALADAFAVRFVFSVAPGDTDRRLTLVVAGIDLETAQMFVKERFGRESRVRGSTVFLWDLEEPAMPDSSGVADADDVAGFSGGNGDKGDKGGKEDKVVARVDVGVTVVDIREGRRMLERAGVVSVPSPADRPVFGGGLGGGFGGGVR